MDHQEDTQAQSDSIAGQTVAGKYRVGAKLGTGGMGSVYRATRLMIGDEVAIKLLRSNQTDPRASERFQREARAAARLKHPNVVAIHDFGTTEEGVQYLVMELVEGDSLRRLIRQQGVIAPATAVEIIRQVCEALDDAHQHDVIHRDIKPDNIIVRSTANGWRVKVLDFGIAKLRDDIAGNLTQTGSIVGTPHYMSPEQCLGEELDSRSDIYSLGVVAYEMLTGLVPFNSPSSSAVVVQHVTQSPPPLRSINIAISPAIEFVVLNALEKKREARPQTGGSFANNLLRALTRTEPVEEKANVHPSAETTLLMEPGASVSSSREVAPTRRKRSYLAYFGLAIGVLVIAGVIFALLKLRKSDTPEPNPQTRTTPLSITSTASSVRLPIQTNTYDAANATDNQRSTAWVEGVTGTGVGEWIRFDFGREIILHRIIIQPGYFKSAQIWKENNRLATVDLKFSDGTSRPLTFTNSMESQQAQLGAVKTSWVMLFIRSVYQGTSSGRYDDTALSDVTFEWEPANAK